jgi:hypothetical protein
VAVGILRRSIRGEVAIGKVRPVLQNTRVSGATLCPLGQSKKAIGPESPIGPCIATLIVDNRPACCFRKTTGAVTTAKMEPQETRIHSRLRTRRRIATLGPEEDHSRSVCSIGRAECREKKIGIEPKGSTFLLTFPLIGLTEYTTSQVLPQMLGNLSQLLQLRVLCFASFRMGMSRLAWSFHVIRNLLLA